MTKIVKNCLACGDVFTTRLADHKRGWGTTCGKACAAAYKTGQRPRDVNAQHARYSPWAAERLAARAACPGGVFAQAPKVRAQVGRAASKVTSHKYHSPGKCPECGTPQNSGNGLCIICDDEPLGELAEGWDGHKEWCTL